MNVKPFSDEYSIARCRYANQSGAISVINIIQLKMRCIITKLK